MKLKPFVQWAGGKRQLLKHLLPMIPHSYKVYHEPFLGGGALLFAIQPHKAVINDSNKELMNCYKQIKYNCQELCELLTEHESIENNRENYEDLRDTFNQKILSKAYDVEMASLFLVLNKRCFNGLYRVNSKGLFNTPWNKEIRPATVNDQDNLQNISKYFNDNDIRIFDTDFINVLSLAHEDDFVFFDSPYVPLSETANFDSYTKNKFTENDHKTLAKFYKKLDNNGVKEIITNHNTAFVRELYAKYNITEVLAQRSINCDTKKRVGKEIIITNFKNCENL